MVLKVVIKGFRQVGISAGSIVANWLLCYIHEAIRTYMIVLIYWSAASQ